MADKTHETKQSNQAVNKERTSAPVEHAAESIASGAPGVEYALADPYLVSPGQLLALQRMASNRAVSRLIQTKLTVDPAHDPYEQEADWVAQQVMRTLAPSGSRITSDTNMLLLRRLVDRHARPF